MTININDNAETFKVERPREASAKNVGCLNCGTLHDPAEACDATAKAKLEVLNQQAEELYDSYTESVIESIKEADKEAAVRAKYHAFTSDEIEEQLQEVGKQQFLIANLFPMHSTALMVGDSGIGKSALLYQLGLCVTSGRSFFGHETKPGRVLYFDYENNIREAHNLTKTLAEFLRLPGVPDNFITWNAHNPSKGWDGQASVLKMIVDLRPTLVIIDTMSKAFKDVEEKNPVANLLLGQLTDLVSKVGCSVIMSHHFKKGQDMTSKQWRELTVQKKIESARGASAVYNGVDVRLLVEPPQAKSFDEAGSKVTCAFEVSGFRRLGGEFTPIAVQRVYREGEPFGYQQIRSMARLNNPKYQQVFDALPTPFRPKDVEAMFPTSGSSAQEFVKACLNARKIVQVELPPAPGYRGTKGYAKVEEPAE